MGVQVLDLQALARDIGGIQRKVLRVRVRVRGNERVGRAVRVCGMA